jgi:SAM-dependent methyltransferase
VLFSYCLSMVGEPRAAIANARSALAPGGKLMIVDFADLRGLPAPAAKGLRRWLELFHVQTIDLELLRELGAELHFGPGRYFVIAELPAE